MRRPLIRTLFTAIFIFMIGITLWASIEEDVIKGFFHVTAFRWGSATLADAYCGFITFFAWVVYRERSWVTRIIWFILILLLGNIAMSAYVLLQLRKKEPLFGAKIEKIESESGV